ncbi:MAG: alpha/beta hydrolase [Clostridia bacterium]|nr:alpha/beta hydrolase [Clostridia bacterium]
MKHERIYLNENDDRVYIDTYVADLGEKRDALLVIPGGGYWCVCTDREGEPIALDFLAKGYNAFVLNYRVGATRERFPAQLIDAASAMVYIREHAEELRINPERVFAVGFSAGGHLTGSLATMFAYPEVKERFGEKYKMVRPTGAILSYPVTVMGEYAHQGSFENLLGKKREEQTASDRALVSLDETVSADSSPMFIWHTVEDKTVPVEGSLLLALALTRAGVPYKLSVYPYGPHGIALSSEVTLCGNPNMLQPLAESWRSEADEWMRTLPDYDYKK